MKEAWRKALRFAALPGAARVRFARRNSIEEGTPTVHYTLRSETQTGEVIGDDRDYAPLKAAMAPLILAISALIDAKRLRKSFIAPEYAPESTLPRAA